MTFNYVGRRIDAGFATDKFFDDVQVTFFGCQM